MGVGYGKQTCNPSARYLADVTDTAIADMVRTLWQVTDETAYERLLEIVPEMTMDYIDAGPGLPEQPAPEMWITGLGRSIGTITTMRTIKLTGSL